MPDEHERLFHVDGRLVPAEAATVSVRDRGFRFGDAAVETLRARDGTPFEWEAHVDRLRASCDVLDLDPVVTDATLRDRVEATLSANDHDADDAVVGITITRGADPPGAAADLTPPTDADPTVVVSAGPTDGNPTDAAVQTVKTRRVSDRAVPARASVAGDVNRVLARLELRVSDADEALMLDEAGDVVGGADAALFFVRGDALCTPGPDGPVAPGVTRSVVLELASAEGLPVREGRFGPDDVRGADEAFLANARRGVRPVASVDGIGVGNGPVTRLLAHLYEDRITAACGGESSGDGASDGDGSSDGERNS